MNPTAASRKGQRPGAGQGEGGSERERKSSRPAMERPHAATWIQVQREVMRATLYCIAKMTQQNMRKPST
jgi:hypothetical protein